MFHSGLSRLESPTPFEIMIASHTTCVRLLALLQEFLPTFRQHISVLYAPVPSTVSGLSFASRPDPFQLLLLIIQS